MIKGTLALLVCTCGLVLLNELQFPTLHITNSILAGTRAKPSLRVSQGQLKFPESGQHRLQMSKAELRRRGTLWSNALTLKVLWWKCVSAAPSLVGRSNMVQLDSSCRPLLHCFHRNSLRTPISSQQGVELAADTKRQSRLQKITVRSSGSSAFGSFINHDQCLSNVAKRVKRSCAGTLALAMHDCPRNKGHRY